MADLRAPSLERPFFATDSRELHRSEAPTGSGIFQVRYPGSR